MVMIFIFRLSSEWLCICIAIYDVVQMLYWYGFAVSGQCHLGILQKTTPVKRQ